MSERIGTKKLKDATEPVNSRVHDEFLALIPLRFSDEISEEDWALLQIHMAYCDICHERYLQYLKLTSEVIPAMAGIAATETDDLPEDTAESLDAAELRLMQAIDSMAVPKERPVLRGKLLSFRLLAAVLALTTAALATILFFGHHQSGRTQVTEQVVTHESPSRISPLAQDNGSEHALQQAKGEIAGLKQSLNISKEHDSHSDEALKAVQEQLAAEQTAHKQTEAEKEALSQQLIEAQSEAASLRAKATSGGADPTEQMLRLTALETKVRELNAALDEKDTALNEKDRMLALDKDFLAHDRDIRDLIGARNLYIADIFDTTETGRTAKQFGRIFYTKDRQLVFYGFDLDSQAGRKQNVSFQVWGSGSDRTAPVSLGLFYQDDSHKRWVLRCNDAKSLARLDTVFVTVEPSGGSSKPTGKPLLRAYLQINANHP